jgi:hypothetical protein
MKKTIKAENLNFAVTNTEKYLKTSGFDTFGLNLKMCVNQPGYSERLASPAGEAWVSYTNVNTFQIEIINR